MSVLIDPPRWPAHGRLWSHLVSDTSVEELQAFADAAGLPRRGFEGDHYDVPQERYERLVRDGATPVEGAELARRLRDSGLRFPKRRGERPLGRYRNAVDGLSVEHVLDIVASPLPVPESATAAAAVLVSDADGLLLLVRSVRRGSWGAPAGGREPGESVRECAVREVQEECGLRFEPAGLVPCGYERLTFPGGRPQGRWPYVRNLVACFCTRTPLHAPPVRPLLDDVDQARWADRETSRELCAEQAWWRLVEHVDPWRR